MITLFHEFLYRPLFNALVALYQFIPGNDFGLAIVALTVLIRLLLLPFSLSTARSQREIQKLNPEIQRIKERHPADQAAQSTAIMALYKEHRVSPLGGCLPLLVQIPVIIALYQAFLAGFKPENLDLLYSFINRPEVINTLSLGFIHITEHSPLLAICAGITQFFQARVTLKGQPAAAQPEMAKALNAQMQYFFPLMIIVIGWNLPAGLNLYWVATALISIVEQWYIRRTV